MTWLIQEVQKPGEDKRAGARPVGPSALAPGLAIAAAVALAALVLEEAEASLTGRRLVEALVIAMVLGVLLRNGASIPAAVLPGATYASKQVLEFAVMLLGASIDVQRVFDGGYLLFLAVTIGVTSGMAISFAVGKALGLKSRLAYLVAVGNSICGNSAIAAVAPVIGAERREIASAIGLTAVAGVIIVLVLPALVPLLALSHYQYGVVAGMAVYAVPQVVAAAFAVSRVSGEVATLVKLTRVMFLGPVVLATGLAMRTQGQVGGFQVRRAQLLPWFVIGFFTLLALRSLGAVPDFAIQPVRDTGRVLTTLAMAGLGMGVEFSSIRSVGLRVGATSGASMVLLVLLSLALVVVLGLDGS